MPIPSDARPRAPSRHLLAAGAVLFAAIGLGAAAEPLTLPEALTRAATHDPARPAIAARVQAAEASLRQAEVRPNPSLGVDLENFAGSGDHSLLDRSEATISYQQTWERGGKREARSGVAQAELSLARARAKVRALDLLAEAQAAWVEALAAQAMIGIAEGQLAAAERLAQEVDRRVRAARDPLFAGERARTAVAQGRIARDQAIEGARQARAALAAFWGGTPDFELDPRQLELTAFAPPGPLTETPDFAVLIAQRDAAASRIRLEQSRAVQDPTWRAGVRHFGEGNEVAVIVGGSIPLGRHDTNRGNIERAQAERTAAEADIAAAHVLSEREAARLTARRAAMLVELRRIDAEVLPGAGRAVAMVRDGFNRGGGAFTYLELADAQRAVIEAKARRIELLKTIHLDGVRLDRLTGRHAALIASAESH
ncbi:MAG: TolC family protein [Pseudomonadota bacterium]